MTNQTETTFEMHSEQLIGFGTGWALLTNKNEFRDWS